MQTSRRTFLGVTVAALAGSALTACASINQNATPEENLAAVVEDVSSIAGAFVKALPMITGIPALTESAKATIIASVHSMQAVADSLAAAASSVTAAQPLVARIEADVNAVIDALSTVPLPPNVLAILNAASVLLPVIELAVKLAVPQAASARAKASGMSPSEARAILRLNG